MLFSIVPGRETVQILEGFAEIAVGQEAALLRDGRDAVVGALQFYRGHLRAIFDQEADGRPVDRAVKTPMRRIRN